MKKLFAILLCNLLVSIPAYADLADDAVASARDAAQQKQENLQTEKATPNQSEITEKEETKQAIVEQVHQVISRNITNEKDKENE